MPTPPSIEYAQNGDVSIAYAVDGDGPIDLLFIPGFVGNLDVWLTHPAAAPFLDRLRSFARLIIFDKRGQGLSDRGRYTVEDVAADAVAVLDAVGVERASVFGVSEGGSGCIALAATYPERVAAMAQFGTYARIARGQDFPEGIPVEVLERTWGRIEAGWAGHGSFEIFAPSARGNPDLEDFWARMLRAGVSRSTRRTLGEMYLALDVRPLLEGVHTPTLVMWRDQDNVVSPHLTRIVADGIEGARGVELPGSDHLFLSGDTDAMLDEVEEFFTGRPTTHAADRVLASVLFVDIVDSTVRATELGDRAWRVLLNDCERAWRREVASEGGSFIKSTGDGFLASFDGPSRAARAALAVTGSGTEFGLRTRAGIHTGECERRDDDISGIAVHLASRIEGVAEPGEVLASGTVRDLSIGSGLSFAPRGAHELKGVPGEWALFAVTAG